MLLYWNQYDFYCYLLKIQYTYYLLNVCTSCTLLVTLSRLYILLCRCCVLFIKNYIGQINTATRWFKKSMPWVYFVKNPCYYDGSRNCLLLKSQANKMITKVYLLWSPLLCAGSLFLGTRRSAVPSHTTCNKNYVPTIFSKNVCYYSDKKQDWNTLAVHICKNKQHTFPELSTVHFVSNVTFRPSILLTVTSAVTSSAIYTERMRWF